MPSCLAALYPSKRACARGALLLSFIKYAYLSLVVKLRFAFIYRKFHWSFQPGGAVSYKQLPSICFRKVAKRCQVGSLRASLFQRLILYILALLSSFPPCPNLNWLKQKWPDFLMMALARSLLFMVHRWQKAQYHSLFSPILPISFIHSNEALGIVGCKAVALQRQNDSTVNVNESKERRLFSREWDQAFESALRRPV